MSPVHPSLPARSPAQLLAEAGKALGQHQVDLAHRLLAQLLATNPGMVDGQFLYGVTWLMGGNAPKAVDFLRKAVVQRPGDANMQVYLGCALHDAGMPEQALPHLRRGCELAPEQASNWYNLGKAYKQQRQLADAKQAFLRTLSLDESHPLARIGMADIAAMQGDIPRAVAEYRLVLRQHPDHAEAWHGLANLKTEPLSRADAEQMRHALRNPALSTDMRIALGFSLFQALDQLQDYAVAFETLREANHVKRLTLDWHAETELRHIERIREAFQQTAPTPLDPTLGHEVILIASMPRSGSTLVEHILASHSEVEGANEIPDLPDIVDDESRRRGQPFPDWIAAATAEDWQRMGKDYLARTAPWRAKHPRFTDKGLKNWQLVGAARAMLPGARIIHCHRDPVETCFSCYRQLFRHGVEYSYDLDEMADVYRDYERLCAFWLTRYPQQVLDFSYEALLQHPEARIRELLAFCKLPFDAACLTPHQTHREVASTASAAQVREPIRADTAHSAPYRQWLQPLREHLQR